MNKLSVVLAVRNEEKNLARCLDSVKKIADEIVVVDEHSSDKTREIAKKYKAKVYLEPHHEIFHITKQKAIDLAKNEWILQMDADEIITPTLSEEIKKIINLSYDEIVKRRPLDLNKMKLFKRHENEIIKRDGEIGKKTGEICAFFIPRLNMFLGKPLRYAGVYPDPALRLFKKGKAHFTGKSVHDIPQIEGEISWLFNDMLHYDSPTLKRYLLRLNRYTTIHAQDLKKRHAPQNLLYLFYYSIILFKLNFLKLYFRHKGFKDGLRGFLWSFFSSMHFPIAYFKYWTDYN